MAAKKKTAAKKKSPAKKSAPKKAPAKKTTAKLEIDPQSDFAKAASSAPTLDSGIPDRSSVEKDVISTPDSGVPDRSDVPKTHVGSDSGLPA